LVEIALEPLTEPELVEFIDSLGIETLDGDVVAAVLARHTGGNPMFVLETLKAMLLDPQAQHGKFALPLPSGVGALIENRLRRVSAPALSLARVAAIADPDFSTALAAQVLGANAVGLATPWAELEAAQVFREQRFAHDLVHEAVVRTIPRPIARHMHAAVAEFLIAHAGEAARIAKHWLEAGDDRRAVEYLEQAAKAAAALGGVTEQADLLETAAEAYGRLGERRKQFETLLALQQPIAAITLVGRTERATTALFDCAQSDAERIEATLARCESLVNAARFEEAEQAARRALADAEHAGLEARLSSGLQMWLATACAFKGRYAEAEQLMREIEPWMQTEADDFQRMEYYGNLGVLLDCVDRHREARVAHETALAMAHRRSDPTSICTALGNMTVSLIETGLFRRAADCAREARQVARERGLGPAVHYCSQDISEIARTLGHYDVALVELESAIAGFRAEGHGFDALAQMLLASAYLHLGQWSRAQQALERAFKGANVSPWTNAKTLLVRARLEAALGKSPESWLEQAARMLPEGGRRANRRQIDLDLALMLPPEEGYRRADAARLEAVRHEQFGGQLSAEVRCARLAPDPDRARNHALEALALLATYDPDDLYRGEVWWEAYRALAAAGDPGATAALRSGVEWVAMVCRDHVPAEFRDSFLNRNVVNREMLARARRERLALSG